jgi:hypothetical protein
MSLDPAVKSLAIEKVCYLANELDHLVETLPASGDVTLDSAMLRRLFGKAHNLVESVAGLLEAL